MKKNIWAVILVFIIIFILIAIIFVNSPSKDIDVEVLNIYDQNNQYFVNVSIKNNQDNTGWISDMHLFSVQGSTIDLTEASTGYKI